MAREDEKQNLTESTKTATSKVWLQVIGIVIGSALVYFVLTFAGNWIKSFFRS